MIIELPLEIIFRLFYRLRGFANGPDDGGLNLDGTCDVEASWPFARDIQLP